MSQSPHRVFVTRAWSRRMNDERVTCQRWSGAKAVVDDRDANAFVHAKAASRPEMVESPDRVIENPTPSYNIVFSRSTGARRDRFLDGSPLWDRDAHRALTG